MGSAEDIIGQIPGSEALASSANKVLAADAGSITKLKTGLQNAHDEAVSTHNSLKSTLDNLSPHWEGSDKISFDGYMKNFLAVDQQAHELMRKGVKGLDAAVRKLDQAKTDVTNALDAIATDYQRELQQAQSDARTHAQQLGHAVRVDENGIAQKVISAHKGKVDAAVQEYDQAMQDVARDLDQAISHNGQGFAKIPAPGEGSTSAQSTPVHSYGGGGDGGGGAASGGGGGGGAMGGVAPDVQVSGNVQQWIDKAKAILAQHGVHLSDADLKALKVIIQHESGGNPNAINLWDSNAKAGHPSQGLMQCIPTTFKAHALPGYDSNIKDPVSNIIAGVRYSIDRYGSLSNVPGVRGVSSGSGYVGY
ncbi:MAG: transglycosylase SLT domain-containing protein [Sciscionella sp.]